MDSMVIFGINTGTNKKVLLSLLVAPTIYQETLRVYCQYKEILRAF